MTDLQTAPVNNPVSRSTLIRKARAKVQPPKAEPSAARRFSVVRHIPRGVTINTAQKVVILVDKNPKLPTAKNWHYFQALIDGSKAGLTVGQIAAKHKDLPIIAEVRHAYERKFIDLTEPE